MEVNKNIKYAVDTMPWQACWNHQNYLGSSEEVNILACCKTGLKHSTIVSWDIYENL